MEAPVLRVKKISEDATIPVYDKSKQYVFFSEKDMFIPANTLAAIPTGISTAFPNNYCLLLVDLVDNIKVLGGLIDSDYRGAIAVITINPVDVTIKKGDPIGRGTVIEIALPEIVCDDYLSESDSDEESVVNNNEN